MRGKLHELGIEPKATYEEIAQELGLSRRYVATIEARAFAKIKENMKKAGLTMDDLIYEVKRHGE